MSYNILYGAGFDRQWDAGVLPNFVGKDRLPDLITVVKAISPDVWGIQEATGWNRGAPPVIQKVAQQLGMNYYLARVPSGFHLGIITKFQILEAENLSAEIGRQGALRATLLSPAGNKLNVFIVHLDPVSATTRFCEVDSLVRKMQPYAGQWTLLLGDMNFQSGSREYQRLEQAGWQPMAVEPSWGIDQIWVYPSARWQSTGWFQSFPTPQNISDHNPVGAEFNVFPATGTPVPLTPSPLTFLAPPPAFVTNALADARTLYVERFDDPCVSSRWTSRWKTEQFANGALEISGEETWQASASRYREFTPGQGVWLRFQFSPGADFEFRFYHPEYDLEPARRFSVNMFNRRVRTSIWQGLTDPPSERFSDDPDFSPNVWYDLLVALGKDGKLYAQVSDPNDPSRVLKYIGALDDKSVDLPWIFQINANRGKVTVNSLTEISFSALK